mgnify:CR=1 FL=1
MERNVSGKIVAPLVGAWIEIGIKGVSWDKERSLPLWERGLKLLLLLKWIHFHNVAPLVGAWIEIKISELTV